MKYIYVCIMAIFWCLNIDIVHAEEIQEESTVNITPLYELENLSSQSIEIGDDSNHLLDPIFQGHAMHEEDKAPLITQVSVEGDVDPSKTGLDFYRNIKITVEGHHLTERHFLTPEGLHWSDKTYVELIKGQEIGVLNDASTFGQQNTPRVPVKAYTNQVGDSGRIHYVGTTQSGEDLDIIWTVTGSDAKEWAKYSGYANNKRIKGLGFTGEQFIPGATGNSIVVLYNNASNLGLHYRIVKHGTLDEMPVIISFISTDIDAAHGVDTNFANIIEIIPKESNLVKKDGIIYDITSGVVGRNGSVDLPKGGYLGAGFVSSFHYVFYSPVPKRINDSYHYPIAVRYDIFGSSLQAYVKTRVHQNIRIDYIDDEGRLIKPSDYYKGLSDERYHFDAVTIPNYQLVDVRKNLSQSTYPVVQFVYKPIYQVTLNFVDEAGMAVLPSEYYKVLKGYQLLYVPKSVNGYITTETLTDRVEADMRYEFVYLRDGISLVDESGATEPESTSPPLEEAITSPKLEEVSKEEIITTFPEQDSGQAPLPSLPRPEESTIISTEVDKIPEEEIPVLSSVLPVLLDEVVEGDAPNTPETSVDKPTVDANLRPVRPKPTKVPPFKPTLPRPNPIVRPSILFDPIIKLSDPPLPMINSIVGVNPISSVLYVPEVILSNPISASGVDDDLERFGEVDKIENKSEQLPLLHQSVPLPLIPGKTWEYESDIVQLPTVLKKFSGYSSAPPLYRKDQQLTINGHPGKRMHNVPIERIIRPSSPVPLPKLSVKKISHIHQSIRDPFLINTNMTKAEKEQFLWYIKEVAKNARATYGNNQSNIDHAISNAIAYSVYHDDLLQRNTNDFGERPSFLTASI